MLPFTAGLLQYLPTRAHDHRIRGDDQLRVPLMYCPGCVAAGGRGFELGAVDGEGFGGGGLKDVFEGGEAGFGNVFGEGGGDYFDVGEADLVRI